MVLHGVACVCMGLHVLFAWFCMCLHVCLHVGTCVRMLPQVFVCMVLHRFACFLHVVACVGMFPHEIACRCMALHVAAHCCVRVHVVACIWMLLHVFFMLSHVVA